MTSGVSCRAAATVLGAALALTAGQATAGGFSLKEGSASVQGASFAGATAGANDISYSFWNPAAMSAAGDGFTIAGHASYILPDVSGTTAAGRSVDGALAALVPANYVAYRMNEQLVVGATISSPFGLSTEYDAAEFGSTIGVNPRRTGLEAVELAALVSYDVHPKLTIAGGPTYIYGKLVFESYADLTTVNAALAPANVEYDGAAGQFGFKLGALFRPLKTTQFGLAYRSGYSLSASGDLELQGAAATLNQLGFNPVPGVYDATFSADLPQTVTFGFAHEIYGGKFRLLGEAQWQDWSALDTAFITSPTGGNTASVFGYHDAWLVALGGEYRATEAVTLRTGVSYDETPTSDADRTARITDQDRVWLSLGATIQVMEHAHLDLSYSFLTATREAEVNGGGVGQQTAGSYDGKAHIFAVGGGMSF